MTRSSHPEPVRRLVLVRPAAPERAAVRRLLLARSGDTLLPPARRAASAPGVRAP